MKMLKKLQKRLQQGKKDNKGFSLVELIIVIAIMAILVGIVGTQVIPYLNKSRVQRDVELLSAISTAAVSAYSSHAENFGDTNFDVDLSFPSTASAPASTNDDDELDFYILEFISYDSLSDITGAMSSAEGQSITRINVALYFTAVAPDHAKNTLEVTAYNGSNQVLQTVTSQL